MIWLNKSEDPVRLQERRRLRILSSFFSFIIVVVLFRALMFQVWKREPWKTLAPSQYEQQVKLVAKRGIIYDRDMNILAMDLPIVSLAVDPTQIKNQEKVVSLLSRTCGDREDHYRELLRSAKGSSFVRIKNDIPEEERKKLAESKILGFIFLKERKRVRPYEALAPQVIGITNGMHQGVGGIEQVLDEVLRGEDGWAIFQRDGLNRNFSSVDYPEKQPKDGNHVILTLNHVYQSIAEEELKKGVERHKAKGGSAVLLDPFSGEVLVMATAVGERLQSQQSKFEEILKNWTTQVEFEPGSTFKIVTAAAALEEGLFTPKSLIHCENGSYRLANHTIHDHDKAFSWLTLSQVLENSSNIGIAKIGRKLGKKTLYKYAQNFGFGNSTGIPLPGEVSGILRPVYHWSEFSTAAMSFGQGISVTSLQLACMVAVIANGGELVKPVILKAIVDTNGEEVKTFSRKVIRRVVSEETAKQLREILVKVVRSGSGTEARVKGVEVAGKTGTAQKSVPDFKGYYPGAYVSSFIGFWPAEAPMFVLVVVLDEPRDMYWGASSAAPIFSRIVQRITGLPESPWHPGQKEKNGKTQTKFVFSHWRQEADHGSSKEDRREKRIDSPYHVPNVMGLSIREALQQLAIRGIEVKVEGSGIVIHQTPEPGRKVEKGMICQLACQKSQTKAALQ